MAYLTFPLNDVEYSAEDMEAYFSTRSSGLVDPEDFKITADGSSFSVKIGAGRAWIKNTEYAGKMFLSDSQISFDLGTPPQYSTTYYFVSIKFTASSGDTRINIKTGASSLKPTQTASEYELFLYKITVESGKTVINQSMIEDLRGQEEYCPFMADTVSPIDKTFSKSGYAADAKMTGFMFEEYKRYVDDSVTPKAPSEKVIDLTDAVKVYSSGDSDNTPRVYKTGYMIQVAGAVSPANNSNQFGTSEDTLIGYLTGEYTPRKEVVVKCQGSMYYSWMLRIKEDGGIYASRYSDGNGYVTPTTDSWMPFSVMFMSQSLS